MKTEKMIVVLGYNTGDAIRAGTLLDWCFELAGRKKLDAHILLVSAPNVHPEFRTKVALAAEVAFASVDAIVVSGEIGDKVEGSNRLFKAAARKMADAYRHPWLWIEPDCVPLKRKWLAELQSAYDEQLRRFYGPHLKFKVGDEEKMCMGRVACYPNDAINDLVHYCDSLAPFNQVAAEVIVGRSTKCRLIQQIDFRGAEDKDKIRADAVLLHSDKTGAAIEIIRQTIGGK